MAPDIHAWLETAGAKDQSVKYVKGNNANKQAIADRAARTDLRRLINY